MNDILLDSSGDLQIVNGDFVIGESTDQEVGLLLSLSPGELKEDPLLGPGLIKLVHANASELEIRNLAKIHLARDGKSWEAIRQRVNLKTNEND